MADALITPEAVLSYPYLFEPRASKTVDKATGQPMMKYSCSLVFLAGSDLKPLKQAYIDAVHEKFGIEKGNEMIRLKKLHSPFRTDWEEKGYPEGSTFLNVTAKQKPGIVSIYRDPNTGKPAKITDPAAVYPGCRVRASVRIFWFEADGNRGFSFGINNLQVTCNDPAKAPRLDGRLAAEDEFEATDDAPEGSDAAASAGGDMSDLI